MADAAIVVIDAGIGAFEAGISRCGSTKSSITLAYSMGVKRFMIVVNKMDVVGWRQERFKEIQREMLRFMDKLGVKRENISVLPISAYLNQNVTSPSEHMSWFKGWERGNGAGGTVKGMTLLEAMDGISVPVRRVDLPLRMPVHRVHDLMCGTVVTGKIIQGKVEKGKTYILQPQGKKVVARSIEVYNRRREEGRTGDLIGVCLGGVGVTDVWAGSVLCDLDSFSGGGAEMGESSSSSSSSGGGRKLSKKKEQKKELKLLATTISIQIKVLSIPGRILPGKMGTMHIHSACIPYKVLAVTPLDRKTFLPIEGGEKFLRTGDSGLLVLELTKPTYVEVFKEVPALGRFALGGSRRIESVGVVKEVVEWNGKVGKKDGKSSFFR